VVPVCIAQALVQLGAFFWPDLTVLEGGFGWMSEVRGTKRRRHGRQTAHPHRPNRSEYHYTGLDGVERRTVLHFNPAPSRLDSHRATFEIDIGPGEQRSLFVSVSCEEGEAPGPGNFFLAYRDTRGGKRAEHTAGDCRVDP